MNMGWALKKGDNSLIVKNTDSFIWKALAKFWPMFSETEM